MADMNHGRIDRARGRIRSEWGTITDEDLNEAQDDFDILVVTIQKRTGQGAEEVRARLNDLINPSDTREHAHPHEPDEDEGQVGGTHYAL